MTPEEKAQEIVIHLHGPDGDSLYHTKNVIAAAIKEFVAAEREGCSKIVFSGLSDAKPKTDEWASLGAVLIMIKEGN